MKLSLTHFVVSSGYGGEPRRVSGRVGQAVMSLLSG